MTLDQHIDSINQRELEQEHNSSKGLTSPTSLTSLTSLTSPSPSMTSPSPSKGGGQERGGQEDAGQEGVEQVVSPGKPRAGYVTADLFNYKYLKEIREGLKHNQTDAEKVMWEYLRNKKTGYKIRRQHVIDNFITDFVCLAKKVVIELDGGIHLQQKEHDELRTFTLNEKGYKVIRFTNKEVLANPESVAIQIKEVLDHRKTVINDDESVDAL